MNHISLAHYFWRRHLRFGDTAIDATCGNGNDTLVLAQCCLTPNTGKVFGIDIQSEAIAATHLKLRKNLDEMLLQRVQLYEISHAPLPDELPKAHLIVYNLGYLPGGDKNITTLSETSILSLESSLEKLHSGGMLSITLYPGHEQGEKEAKTIFEWAVQLPQELYCLSHHYRIHRLHSPSLLLIKKLF